MLCICAFARLAHCTAQQPATAPLSALPLAPSGCVSNPSPALPAREWGEEEKDTALFGRAASLPSGLGGPATTPTALRLSRASSVATCTRSIAAVACASASCPAETGLASDVRPAGGAHPTASGWAARPPLAGRLPMAHRAASRAASLSTASKSSAAAPPEAAAGRTVLPGGPACAASATAPPEVAQEAPLGRLEGVLVCARALPAPRGCGRGALRGVDAATGAGVRRWGDSAPGGALSGVGTPLAAPRGAVALGVPPPRGGAQPGAGDSGRRCSCSCAPVGGSGERGLEEAARDPEWGAGAGDRGRAPPLRPRTLGALCGVAARAEGPGDRAPRTRGDRGGPGESGREPTLTARLGAAPRGARAPTTATSSDSTRAAGGWQGDWRD